jgi:crotonobetainyl-CoA:carnitine CoA-transferase CaiB-like acyl-CoA transferase
VADGALAGVRILDLSRVLAGPYCTQILADHGADVIKVEPPQGDETRTLGPPFIGDVAAYYHGLNRNKLGVALDLSTPQGRDVALRLMEQADVVIENFLPGTMEKWGLGYEAELAARFPRLVYCRISGFGSDGPLAGLPGYDAVLQAFCGLMSVNGHADSGATRLGIPVVDLATGLSAVGGVLLALLERQRSGKGQLVECALFDVALSLLHPHAANWMASGRTPALSGNAHPNISPYDKFAGRDGDLFLGILNDAQFARFCHVIGCTGLLQDARFADNRGRVENRAALREGIEPALQAWDTGDACEALMRAGVPAARVNAVPDVLQHPQAMARAMRVELDGYQGLGVPVKLARTPGSVRRKPPEFGADTRAVLQQAGFSEEQIQTLIDLGVAPTRRVTRRSPAK